MKTRLTYIYEGDNEFEPTQTALNDTALSLRSLKAAKQERILFDYTELPHEIRQVLKKCRDLRIRWASERPYAAVAPFSSRVSPGLHVVYTPANSGSSGEPLCRLLQKTFSDEIDCTVSPLLSSPASFISTTDSVPRLKFHTLLPSLPRLLSYVNQYICQEDAECRNHVASISSASSLDIDYSDSTAHLMVAAYWAEAPVKDGWTEVIKQPKDDQDRVEIGILAEQNRIKPEEVKVGGLLADVGRKGELTPTLFGFNSRHHPIQSTYRTQFPSPTGLHPTLQISIPQSSLSPPSELPQDTTCSLYTYLSLPSTIFADKYQLSTKDPLFLQSHNLVSLHSIQGETDLEAPDWITHQWGSNLLLELATPASDAISDSALTNDEWNITIPLHLRYLHPSPSGYRDIYIPWPVVFWACANEDEAAVEKQKINPFDRVSLGWESSFPAQTTYHHLQPSPPSSVPEDTDNLLVETITVPVLNMGHDTQRMEIQVGTAMIIIGGFMWVLWKLGLRVNAPGSAQDEPEESKKDQ
ncbi:pbn1 [Arthroderma uncinatum]|uniref:pbn1 n=1 Tax=Arthroderma uncinatum TaxID=74035 RepID=UPI00144A59F7|nr:pbn1 [Arthroderma uncinatum]KAF3482393.1 pbn1 [Arthroderma uncinatum]